MVGEPRSEEGGRLVTALMKDVPRLDELAQDPKLADGLPRSVLVDVLRIVGHLQVELDARLRGDAESLRLVGREPEEDCAVGLEEAAKILGMKRGTLYRKWRGLGVGYRDADGRVKFTRSALQRYLARKGP